MKKLFTILSVLLISYITLLSQAPNVEGFVPLRVTYNSVKIIDENTFIAAGTNGAVIISKDGGKTWNRRYLENGENIVDIEIFNNEIFLLCNDGKLYKSDDLGITFTLFYTLENAKPNSISMNKNGYGVIVGDSSTIFTTEDGGKNWIKENANLYYNINEVVLNDKNEITINVLDKILQYNFGNFSEYAYLKPESECTKCPPLNITNYKNNTYFMYDGKLYKSIFKESLEQLLGIDSIQNYRIINDTTIILFKKARWHFFDAYKYNTNDSTNTLICDNTNKLLTDNISLNSFDTYQNLIIGVGPNSMIYMSIDAGSNWKQISNLSSQLSLTGRELEIDASYFFVNDSTFFVNGIGSAVYGTNDGGTTFFTQDNVITENNIYSVNMINFKDEKNGFCFVKYSGDYSFMLTEDGGKTYDYKMGIFGSDKLIKKIDDNSYIFAFYSEVPPGYCLVSTTNDYFKTVTKHYIDTLRIQDFEINNKQELYFTGTRLKTGSSVIFDCFLGKIILNNDTLSTSIMKEIPGIKQLAKMHRFDNGEIIALGQDFDYDQVVKNRKLKILRSTDEGNTWYEVYNILQNNLTRNDFYEEDGVIYLSNGLKLLYTTDKGATWLEKDKVLPIKTDLLSTYWHQKVNNTTFVGCLVKGLGYFNFYIYKSKTDKDIITSVENQVESKPIWWVSNPYPNPYTNVITLDYAYDMMYSQNDFKFSLYNVLGVKISDLVPDFSLSNGNQGKVSLNIPYSNQLFYLHINFKGTNKVYPIFGISN